MNEPKWLFWARSMISVAETGLYYSKNIEEKARYNLIRDIAFDMINNYSNMEKDDLMIMFEKLHFYATPQVTVRGIVLNEGKLLLVKERKSALWNLPGGYAEVNLSPSESIIKEVKEECGILVQPSKILAIYESKYKEIQHRYNIFFKCDLVNKYENNGFNTDEISEVNFVTKEEMKNLPLNKYLVEQLERLDKYFYDDMIPTEFD